MENLHDAGYIVYVRQDDNHNGRPGTTEEPLKICSSYAEAREIQRQYRRAYQETVIRYDGVTGGGD